MLTADENETTGDTKMTKKIPKFLAKRYEEGSHGFRMEKRKQIREINKIVRVFMSGAYYFPDEGYEAAIELRANVERLIKELSVKNWGR